MASRRRIILVLFALVVAGGFALYRRAQGQFTLPNGGETTTETITLENGQLVETAHETTPAAEGSGATTVRETREIMVTDGVRHSVALDEIVGGGPPRDGIPSIDEPKFVSIEAAGAFLGDEEPGLAVAIGGEARFYPFQILVWHEIVNDTFGGQRVLVTYCPLCLSGIVFDPVVAGERVEFGTSGKLWQSNLVMYDRATESLWSQVLGEAIVGPQTGTRLTVLPSDQTRFAAFKAAYPDGQVLSRDTGALRTYGSDPYGDYYTTPGVFFPTRNRDDRLADKEFVLGIVIDGEAKAYRPEAIKAAGTIRDAFQGRTIVAEYDATIDAVRLFTEAPDGTRERLNPFANYWFSWVAAHPGTALYP